MQLQIIYYNEIPSNYFYKYLFNYKDNYLKYYSIIIFNKEIFENIMMHGAFQNSFLFKNMLN
jgi:hypothetical protein